MSIDYQELSGKLIIENGELKNQLSQALQELEDVYNMVEEEPNDMRLGKMVRLYYWENTEEPESVEEPIYIYESPDEGKTLYRRQVGETAREQVETPEPPVSRERAEARLQYLRTEIAHEDYHDGWTLQGMKDEVKWLESQLGIDSKQMELFEDK